MVKRSILFFSICLLIAPLAKAQQQQTAAPFTFQPGQSVYVVAVRHNTTMTPEIWDELIWNSRGNTLPPSSASSGYPASDRGPAYNRSPTYTPPRNYPKPPERVTLERQQNERPTLDRAEEPTVLLNRPIEPDLNKAVIDALRKQKKFKLVDSVEQADFVLLVQGEYLATFTKKYLGGGDSRGAITIFNGNPDLGEAPEGNQLIQIQGLAIPSAFYRQADQRLPDNAETVRWRGHLTGAGKNTGGFSAPSVESLIKKFHKETLK